MDIDKLKELIDLDTFGLLDVKHKSTALTRDEKLLSTFEEINTFIDENKKEPNEDGSTQEFLLYSRLNGIRNNPTKMLQLKEFDRHNLLKTPEDMALLGILSSDKFAFVDDEDEAGIFNLTFVPDPKERAASDFIAKRKPCPNFEKYEELFKACQADIKSGERKLEKFNEKQRLEGQFFVLNGVLFLMRKIYHLEKGPDGKLDGRTHLIFENGTESSMLFRSITKRLFENGQHVSDENLKYDTAGEIFNQEDINEEDELTGYVYILSSKSRNKDIKSIKNLYKIGYCEGEVNARIKNAKNEPTYLMAEVKVIETAKIYNANPQKCEKLLHKFFTDCKVSIDVHDNNGTRHTVHEWFQIPLEDIETAINLINTKEILNYIYNKDEGFKEI